MPTDEEFNNLKDNVEEIKKSIRDLELKEKIEEQDKFQLKYPLDTISKKIVQDVGVREIVIFLEANSTPVAITGAGKIFTISDNTLWFQDADGTIHRITLAT